jgi:ferric-dicitrate binding protein FerR (iron transport regulator)
MNPLGSPGTTPTVPRSWRAHALRLPALALAGLLTVQTCAAASQAVAHVRFIDHGLTVLPPGKRSASAHLKEPLYSSYGLRTLTRQRASISFADRTVLHINQRTDLVLASSNHTRVLRGEVAELGKPGGNEQIITATAVASALGTEFDLRIERGPSLYGTSKFPAGTTTVSVVTGSVAVSNARGSVTVTAGHWTHVLPGQAPTTPTKHNARKDMNWAHGLPGPRA